eukprot:CAMPEP_0113309578 /NCGR_PEP_ID=MMETSP0010_2-20120614/7563_1 /TAXON_ID=216773 ORGANISM="Corethron hystrix, Strain 308" /NCGR_SAMPLE_ID=MMETSP0010_2 /ASSEMBLY_ACC=CAM_ASM_000155 /LENGTH=335 /DNA_ID=CAMNT_0000164853 /DNA_START=12 /DNA_END=1020 /DNA_ORIENTATION=- /assembly_acc=CAM_ASM_000155
MADASAHTSRETVTGSRKEHLTSSSMRDAEYSCLSSFQATPKSHPTYNEVKFARIDHVAERFMNACMCKCTDIYFDDQCYAGGGEPSPQNAETTMLNDDIVLLDLTQDSAYNQPHSIEDNVKLGLTRTSDKFDLTRSKSGLDLTRDDRTLDVAQEVDLTQDSGRINMTHVSDLTRNSDRLDLTQELDLAWDSGRHGVTQKLGLTRSSSRLDVIQDLDLRRDIDSLDVTQESFFMNGHEHSTIVENPLLKLYQKSDVTRNGDDTPAKELPFSTSSPSPPNRSSISDGSGHSDGEEGGHKHVKATVPPAATTKSGLPPLNREIEKLARTSNDQGENA